MTHDYSTVGQPADASLLTEHQLRAEVKRLTAENAALKAKNADVDVSVSTVEHDDKQGYTLVFKSGPLWYLRIWVYTDGFSHAEMGTSETSDYIEMDADDFKRAAALFALAHNTMTQEGGK